MKRSVFFLLVLFLLAGTTLSAGAADPLPLPEPMTTVSTHADSLRLPATLPPAVEAESFSIDDENMIHLDLEDTVPRLKILERDGSTGVESTIFTKKNTSSAKAHMAGKESSVFIIRMIWNAGKFEFVREYTARDESLFFTGCSATETVDPAAFAPYTSAVRTLNFSESGDPLSETWTLQNNTDRFIRTVSYDEKGALKQVRQTWEPVSSSDYLYVTETDGEGNLTALRVQDKKSVFYAISIGLYESPEPIDYIAYKSVDTYDCEDMLEENYPKLFKALTEDDSDDDWDDEDDEDDEDDDDEDDEHDDEAPDKAPEPTATPSPYPENTRIWSLNFDSYADKAVFAYITADPLLILKNGKTSMNPRAKDINGRATGLTRYRIPSVVLEIPAAE